MKYWEDSMKANLQQRLILSFVVIILMSILGSYFIINGIGLNFFYQYYEEPFMDNKIDIIEQQHNQIKALLIDKAKNKTYNYDDLDSYSFEDRGERIGHLILKDESEIYRSPSLDTLPLKELISNEFLDVFEEQNRLIIDQILQANIIFPNQTYDVYSYYIFPVRENPYAFVYGLYNISIFSVIIILSIFLLAGIFRHMRRNMRTLTHMTEQIIQGDLDNKMHLAGEGEFTLLANAVDTMRQDLRTSAEEKQQIEEERERMFLNIAHDIKTPITSIKGFSQVLANDYILDDQIKKEYLTVIVNKSQVIEKMVDDLGDIIQYQGSSLRLNRMTISIKDFLEDCINEFLIDSDDSLFNIALSIDATLDKLHADPTLLQRVFTNIISNSIKYNPDEHITITIKCEGFTDYIAFSIIDTGIGVPDGSLPKLFDRLYRVDSSRNGNIEGSGIGLSICKEIIEAHGGKIQAHNTKDGFMVQFNLLNEEILK